MSRNNIIKENNKKLFESRLQMKAKNVPKRTQISFEQKRYIDNISLLNNSQPFSKAIFNKQWKHHSTLENSFINNINNSLINRKILKINKINKQKTPNININLSQNKSNILIKDITFFHLKKLPNNNDIQNKTIINVNKRFNDKSLSKKNRPKNNRIGTININIKKNKKNNNKRINLFNTIARSMTTINESNNNITINNSNYIMNNTNININNINNGNNNRIVLKDKLIPKCKLSNNDTYIKIPYQSFKTNTSNINRKNSDSNKKINRYNSFLVKNIEKIKKFEKKQTLNNTNFSYHLKDVNFGTNLNKKGRNSINLFQNNINNNKKTIDISTSNIQRNIFLGKYLGKLKQKKNNEKKYSNNTSRPKKQNLTLNNDNHEKECNYSNKNLNNNKYFVLNKFFLKEKDKKISRNNIDKKSVINNKVFTQELKTFNALPKKKLANTIINNGEFDCNNIMANTNKYQNKVNELDKNVQAIDDNINVSSTKTNDEFFSEEKNNKVNETSNDEESGILSINEVQDIIRYIDMYNIKKEDNFLFKYNDYNNFIEKNSKIISNKFFGNIYNNINNNECFNQNTVMIKKNFHFFKQNFSKDFQVKNYLQFKILTHNNSIKKK